MAWSKNTRYGRNAPTQLTRELASIRLLERAVVHEDGCWGWRGQIRKGRGDEPRPVLRVASKRYWANRLAAYAWLDFELDSKLQINHHCDNPICIRPDHLYVGTQGQNISDSYRRNRRKPSRFHGENATTAKLTKREAILIIRLRKRGYLYREIAAVFNVGTVEVWRICNGQRWARLTAKEREQP